MSAPAPVVTALPLRVLLMSSLLLAASGPSAAQRDRWEPIESPAGGWLDLLDSAPGRSRRVIARYFNTLVASTDGGQSWRGVGSPGMLAHSGHALLRQDPTDEDRIFYARVLQFGEVETFVSHDAGMSFQALPEPRGLFDIDSNTGELTMAGADGILRSADHGNTWALVPEYGQDWSSVRALPASGGVLAWKGHLEHSTLHRSFFRDGPMVQVSDDVILDLEVAPLAQHVIWGYGPEGIYRSVDEGWSWRRTPFPQVGDAGSCENPLVLVPHPTDPDRAILAWSDFVHLTSNGGKTWTRSQNQNVAGCSVQSITYHPTDFDRVLLANSAGVWKSYDGGLHWEHSSSGLREGLWQVAFDPHDPQRIRVAGRRISDSGDGGLSWETTFEPSDWPGSDRFSHRVALAVSEFHPGRLLAWSLDGGDGQVHYFRSVDGGDAWRRLPAPSQSFLGTREHSLVEGPHGEIYALSDKLYRTLDEGQTWSVILDRRSSRLIFDPRRNGRLHLVAHAKDGPGRVYIRSEDGGRTWSRRTQGLELAADYSVDVALDPRAPDRVYLTGVQSLYRSEDGGITWTRAGQGLEGIVENPIVDPHVAGRILLHGSGPAGQLTRAGMWRSDDFGETFRWALNGVSGPPGISVHGAAFHPWEPGVIWALHPTQGGLMEFRF